MGAPLRVLHVGKYFAPYSGGMETYLRDLMTAQIKRGWQSVALVHQLKVSLFGVAAAQPVGHGELDVICARVWLRVFFTPISPSFPWLLRKLIREKKPQVLHLHLPNASAFWVLLLPSARRLPWVVHWHSDVLTSSHSLGLRIFYRVYRLFERAVLRHANAIIVTSPPYLDASRPLRDFHEKCHVVPLGLDPVNLPNVPSNTAASNPSRPLRVLAVGRLTYYKGFEFLISAAADCAFVEVHIVGVGERGAMLKALAARLAVSDRVIFHGHLSAHALAEQFASCDCLCLPSIERTEAFGLVLLEAMYYARATVVSCVRGSGMGWVVKDGVTGLHVAPENKESLSTALRHMYGDRARVRTLGIKGRDRFYRHFHIDESAMGVEKVYYNVLCQDFKGSGLGTDDLN